MAKAERTKLKNFNIAKMEITDLYRTSEGNGTFLYKGMVTIKGSTNKHGFFYFGKDLDELKQWLKKKFHHLTNK